VLEERDVIGGRLDTQDDAEFVVHLDRGFAAILIVAVLGLVCGGGG
jgi:hypothetical protein